VDDTSIAERIPTVQPSAQIISGATVARAKRNIETWVARSSRLPDIQKDWLAIDQAQHHNKGPTENVFCDGVHCPFIGSPIITFPQALSSFQDATFVRACKVLCRLYQGVTLTV
jgi:hypothetical protein